MHQYKMVVVVSFVKYVFGYNFVKKIMHQVKKFFVHVVKKNLLIQLVQDILLEN